MVFPDCCSCTTITKKSDCVTLGNREGIYDYSVYGNLFQSYFKAVCQLLHSSHSTKFVIFNYTVSRLSSYRTHLHNIEWDKFYTSHERNNHQHLLPHNTVKFSTTFFCIIFISKVVYLQLEMTGSIPSHLIGKSMKIHFISYMEVSVCCRGSSIHFANNC